MTKLAIIGAGPAGLTAAIAGANGGFTIDLFNKDKIGENIRCAEAYFETTNQVGAPKYGIRCKVDELVLKIKEKYTFSASEETKLWIIDRQKWQQGLADEARALGVNIIENTTISQQRLTAMQTEYDWIIDCSGAPSVTSKAYGFENFYKEHSNQAAQITLRGNLAQYKGKIEIAFTADRQGHFWIIPKSDQEVNVGIVRNGPVQQDIWTKLTEFLQQEGLEHYEQTNNIGGIIPIAQPEKLVYDKVLLAGDAAGLVSTLHTGGIDNACASGKLAIQSILNDEVDQYEDEINKALGKKLEAEQKITEMINRMSVDILDNVVKMVHATNSEIGDYPLASQNEGQFGEFGIIKGIVPYIGRHMNDQSH